MASATAPPATPPVVTAARFRVTANAMFRINAYFTDLGGIQSEIEPATYVMSNARQGGSTLITKQFGQAKPPVITLRRGVDGSGEMWIWHRLARMGFDFAKVNAALTLIDASGTERGTYDLEAAWPVKVEVSGVKAGAGEVVYESVTLVCDEITFFPSELLPDLPTVPM
ncbi:phage tail protein [Streptacidiphilus anmyonensis]|uniref:phage tail protein n=1 Tax=Streptacidiphilus anmyonensis TaxID=405782 RepID=UPI0005A60249|nr:phage tail protein [Streptacidiphilus anmyonensis]